MDPIPAGTAPVAVGADKVPETVATTTSLDAKPTESVAAETKPVEEKKDEEKDAKKEETAPAPETSAAESAKLNGPPAPAPPADAPTAADSVAGAPKPASIEEVPDKDGPVATTGVEEPKSILAEQSAATSVPSASAAEPEKKSIEEPKPIPAEKPAVTSTTDASSAPAAEPVKKSVEEPIPQEPAKEPTVEDEPVKEPITEKPEAVNGAATKDVEMTGALNDAEPAGAGEREAAPQSIASEAKAGDKRKADDLAETNGANGTNGVEEAPEDKPAEKKAKRGPGRPSNGAAKQSPKKDSPNKEKESFGHKVARNVKKVMPAVGRTERKTRSQGPA
ncbi:hypothetical protein CH063_07123 [Colletotrichum higginsianum]|uniref:Uncharacterized protein n=2 Tax=Colletotrichum higginsianum TaxID=80884 RepID=H1V508_COLHI|nr:hypothetical protein CH63R_11411 [Colletotrichum higginsianum IMI 349063]OBR04708.1 hypothetical protein CH63R_11411 [Colletotrichum higginsianum IMI 349063]TIC93582.1 hypothetical protein CH35J_009140 [Colletotrichum higginsianum]GJC99346.1 hypothetical protein ColKHC_08172 [Colletotrichum higginsianum]CCF35310.1 hypothetical protein CH063_07123 [Colletotrichum higginsianum]